MQAVAKLTYELGRQANIAVDAKKENARNNKNRYD